MANLSDLYIRVGDEKDNEIPVLKQGKLTVLSKQNISLITGKPGSRKTFLVSALVSALIGEKSQLGLNGVGINKILWIDTEQSRYDFSRRLAISSIMASENEKTDLIDPLSFRILSVDERVEMLEEAVEQYTPDVIFLDGIAQFINDFNNISQSTILMNVLYHIAESYNCHICCVLHQNKADGNAKGHFGSMITQAAQTVFSIVAGENSSRVFSPKSRGKKFEQFSFGIDENGMPKLTSIDGTPDTITKNIPRLSRAFNGESGLRYTEITKRMTMLEGVSKKQAEKIIGACSKYGYLTKDGDGIYHINEDYEG